MRHGAVRCFIRHENSLFGIEDFCAFSHERDAAEYNDIGKAKSFIEMLNQKEAFTQKLINRDEGVIITIGNENCDENMQDCSMITATYHVDGKLIANHDKFEPRAALRDDFRRVRLRAARSCL